jgi:pimeloyl-ACP methyl ester carboxylesterase
MKRLFILLALTCWACGAHAGTQTDEIAGTWWGTLKVDPVSITLVFHIEKQAGGYSATMDSPDQGAKGIPITSVTFERDTLMVAAAQMGVLYTGTLKGEIIEGTFSQGGMSAPLNLTRGEPVASNRPQEPKPPFPYRVEEVVFENPAAGIRFAGTLTMPFSGTNFPAVVLITGSGAQNRDEEVMGHKPFLVLADHLTRHGIAVLRYDDRGVGGSQRGPAGATSADLATDAIAALDYLRTRPDIDHAKTGLAGHSEGGLVAFIATANNPGKVAFIVSMAGPAVRGDQLILMQVADIAAAHGVPASEIGAAVEKNRRDNELIFGDTPESVEADIDSYAARAVPDFDALPDDAKNAARAEIRTLNSPWMRFLAEYNPVEDLARVKCPVLAINGSKDVQVRASANLIAIRAGLETGGNTAFEIIEYPGLNHLFQTAETGLVEEYAKIEETFSPSVLKDIADWILKIVG